MLLDFGRRSSRRRRSGGMDDTGEPEEGEVMHDDVSGHARSSSDGADADAGNGDGNGNGNGSGSGSGGGGGSGGSVAVPDLVRQTTPHGGTVLTTLGARSARDISFTDDKTYRSLYRVLRAVEYMHAVEHCPLLVSLAKLCYLVLDDLHLHANADANTDARSTSGHMSGRTSTSGRTSGRTSTTDECFDREACTYEILTKVWKRKSHFLLCANAMTDAASRLG